MRTDVFAVIANLTAPHIGHVEELCGGWHSRGGGGAAYAWCKHALDSSVIPLDNLVGHSYGINTWDDWSRLMANEFNMETHLYDCFITKPFTGGSANYKRDYHRHKVCVGAKTELKTDQRKEYAGGEDLSFKTMGDTALNGRQPLSVVVKMDVEGAEWPVLNAMTAEDHSKILLFDLEIHWCRGFDKYSYGPRIDSQLQRAHYAMKEIAKLKKYYVFVDRKMSRSLGIELLDPPKELTWDDAGCDMKKHYDMMSISLVNKNFLDILRQK